MRISKVYLDHFLSLKGIFLQDLNDLNILIGKNNAGKSNMVKAIHTFFNLLPQKTLVNENTPLAEKTYFYDFDTSTPITMGITFTLNSGEALSLLKSLETEVFGAKEFWADVEGRNRITYVIKNVCYMNKYFAYLSEIALGDVKFNSINGQVERNTVFRMNEESAYGFLQYYQDIVIRGEKKDLLEQEGLILNLEDFQFVKTFDELENATEEEELKYGRIPPEIKQIAAKSEDYQAFRQNLRQEIILLEHEIQYYREKEMDFDLEVSGKVTRKLPGFLGVALDLLAGFSIVFIHDRKEAIKPEEAKKLFYLKNTREGYPKFERLREILQELVDVNLEMWLNPDGTIDMDVDRMLLIFNGAGVRETLRVILDIYLQDANCILIEEPEVHLHPVVGRTLYEHIKEFSKKTQMFITTHSPDFIDVSIPQTLFLMKKKKNQPSRVFNLNGEKVYQLFSAWGLNDSEAFFRDALVFVEHWYDENILRIISAKTKYNLNKMNIQFVHFNNLEHLIEMHVQNNFDFSQQKIKLVFLLHENEHNMERIEEMRKKLPRNCLIFPKSEVLNYLFAPRAVLQFLYQKNMNDAASKAAIQNLTERDMAQNLHDAMENTRNLKLAEGLQRGGKLPSVLEVNEIVKMVKDCLYNYVQIKDSFAGLIEKKRLSWEEYKLEIAQDFLEIESRLEKKWIANKHALISGEDILKKVMESYGTNFDLLKGDGDRLAQLLAEEEIDPDLLKVFQTISEFCSLE